MNDFESPTNFDEVDEANKASSEEKVDKQMDELDRLGKELIASNPELFREAKEVELSSEQKDKLKKAYDLLGEMNNLFREKYDLSVDSEDKLPDIVMGDKYCLRIRQSEIGPTISDIMIEDKSDLNDQSFAEELSHFYRRYFQPSGKETLTDEFFGFLGRRLWYATLVDRVDDSDFLRQNEPNIENIFPGGKKGTSDSLRKIRKAISILEDKYNKAETDIRKRKIIKMGDGLMTNREDVLTHYRGYDFASKVDLNKIKDWKKLFSMPDKEVRMRFFTTNPDYSDLG